MIQISNPKDCCGCETCVQVCAKQCISLHRDEKGFLYPRVIEEQCVNCGLCEKVCPVLHPFNEKEPKNIFASKNDDERERENSSSGGIFILFAKQVILHGGVVFGVTFDDNWNPVHSFSETLEGLTQFQGSKYVQSRIDSAFVHVKRFLEDGREVLFSGTPCQIAGLKHFLHKDYEKLLTIEVICHGVPSPGVWKDYLDSIQRPKNGIIGNNPTMSSQKKSLTIKSISFRNKQEGWQKFNFVVRFLSDNRDSSKLSLTSENVKENIVEFHQENLFMRAFLKNLILRPSCFSCPAKSGRSGADISLGDFWSINQHLKEWNDDKGVTLVYINSDKGQDYYRHIKCSKIELNPLVHYNKMYYSSTVERYPNEKFWTQYKQDGLEAILPIYNSLATSKKANPYKHVYSKLKKQLKVFINKLK